MTSQAIPTERQALRATVRERYLRFAHRCVKDGNNALASCYFRMAAELEQAR
jgi:hypothetical protein